VCGCNYGSLKLDISYGICTPSVLLLAYLLTYFFLHGYKTVQELLRLGSIL